MCKITDFTTKKKEKFLVTLAATGNITKACESVNATRPTAYTHKSNDPDFAAAWDTAIETYITFMEQEADRRATEGLLKKKFLKNGDPVIDPATGQQYVEREYSDTLLMFRLKALKPEKYRDNVKVEQETTVKLLLD
jgi:CRISPR/Cas system-associated protein Csx1